MALPRIPSPKEMWIKHEMLVLEVFTLALEMLRRKVNLPVDEDAISEVLTLETRQANFSLNRKGRGLQFPPDWEKPKQPTSKVDLGKSKKKKRPDFSCPFRNNSAQCAKDAYLDYHIKCKRLGEASSPSWNLNKNYMTNGIVRFLEPPHRYGEGTYSGAMIGYVQNMNIKSILEEVNRYIFKNPNHKIPEIRFSEVGFGDKGIAKASQQLIRTHVFPSPFDLYHLWVDLRQ